MSPKRRYAKALRPALFSLCLLPLAWLAWRAGSGGLGANPIEAVNRYLGDWALRFLLVALAVTPVTRLTGWTWLMARRRMLGLFAFAYATLHLLSYVGLDQFFDFADIGADILKRNYITVGMACYVILLALAVTSPKAMVKRLGARSWKALHRLVYAASVGAVFHFAMMIKADLREPLIYAGILAVLLGFRAVTGLRRKFRPEGRRTRTDLVSG
ncbi:MAG: sulfoxide reductase heme-binding subunit YedZ [Rhodospirillales bacterium]|nr:sulfoxide reductase heme-binding subunit YedZ [Rhodospirillales bacterium]